MLSVLSTIALFQSQELEAQDLNLLDQSKFFVFLVRFERFEQAYRVFEKKLMFSLLFGFSA